MDAIEFNFRAFLVLQETGYLGLRSHWIWLVAVA